MIDYEYLCEANLYIRLQNGQITFITKFVKMLKRFRKKDNWNSIGDVQGYLAALNKIGSLCQYLDAPNQGYAEPNSIWGQVADQTDMPNKNTYDVRKWLYTVWKDNRRNIRSLWYLQRSIDGSPEDKQSSGNSIKDGIASLDEVQ